MTITPKKHLGQHFLKDERIAKDIVDSLSGEGYGCVLEVGPGTGVLTKYLIEKDYTTYLVEIDSEAFHYLKEHYPALSDRILCKDFLRLNISELFGDKQFAIIGNFPYNISTQIVFKALENKHLIPEFSGMFQQEVAERIVEKAGSKKYGILSVLAQAFYDVEYLFTVPPTVFENPPKVNSGVIRMVRKKNYTLPVEERLFYSVVKKAFNQRRKSLRNSLKSFDLSEKLRENPLLGKRPEQLSVEAFIELTSLITQDGAV